MNGGRGRWTPWLVLLGAGALTIGMTVFVWWSARARDEARFVNAVQSAQDRVTGRLDIYLATLRGGAALFAASEEVEYDEFRTYVEHLNVQNLYPGIQGVGWTRRLEHGLTGDVDEIHAIEYLEPPDERNQAALGYDMYSEPTRREAMARARDTAMPALSGRVRLVQEIFGPEQAGFLLYVPVYMDGAPPPTIARRRQTLLGFVYSPFRAGDLFAGIFGTEEFPRVSLDVYDGAMVEPGALLYQSERAAGHESAHVAHATIEIGGRTWTLVFRSLPQFEAGSNLRFVPLVLMAGLLATTWLFVLARSQARAREQAERANQAKAAFLAVMSHELRTPLNAIGGYVDLMVLGIPEPVGETQKHYLSRIQRAQKHLLGLINDVLDYARLEAGRTVIRAMPVRVTDVVVDAETMIAPEVRAKGLNFERGTGPDVTVTGDRDKLGQIVVNLLSNAVKFTDEGGRIATRWAVRDGHVEVQVEDSGIGIEPEQLHTIFEAFVQVDGDLTRRRQGTGLGLAISQSLAESMGGSIEVRSQPGVGSVFTLVLPLADVGSDPSAPAATA